MTTITIIVIVFYLSHCYGLFMSLLLLDNEFPLAVIFLFLLLMTSNGVFRNHSQKLENGHLLY